MAQQSWNLLYIYENRAELILTVCTCSLSFLVTLIIHLQMTTRSDIWSFGIGFFLLLWIPYLILLPNSHSWISWLLVVISCLCGGFLFWLWNLDWQTNAAMAISTLLSFKCQVFHEQFQIWMNTATGEVIQLEATESARKANEEEKKAKDQVQALNINLQKAEARSREAEERAREAERRSLEAEARTREAQSLLAEALEANQAQSKEVAEIINKMRVLTMQQEPSH